METLKNNDDICLTLVDGNVNFEEFLSKLSSANDKYKLVLEVAADDVFKSTGMICLTSNPIAWDDVLRVMQASIPLATNESQFLLASTKHQFLIDDTLHSEFQPIGICGRKLEVKVEYVSVSKNLFKLVNLQTNALGKVLVGWSVVQSTSA